MAKEYPRGQAIETVEEIVLLLILLLVPLVFKALSENPMLIKWVFFAIGVVGLLLLRLVAAAVQKRLTWHPSPLHLPLLAMFVSAFVSFAAFGYRYSYAGFERMCELLALAGFYFLISELAASPARIDRMIKVIAVSAAAVCFYGLIQHLQDVVEPVMLHPAGHSAAALWFYRNIEPLAHDPIKWLRDDLRIISTFGNATYLAGFLAMLLPVMINRALFPGRIETLARFSPPSRETAPSKAGKRKEAKARRVKRPQTKQGRQWPVRLAYIALSLFMLLNLFWTYSRAAWLGAAVGLALNVILLLRVVERAVARRILPVMGATLALILAAAVVLALRIPQTQRARIMESFSFSFYWNQRLEMLWVGGLQIFREHPALGSGPGTYQIYSRTHHRPELYMPGTFQYPGAPHSHNEFIELLSDQGLPGLLTFLWFLAVYVWMVRKALRGQVSPAVKGVVIAFASGTLALLIQNMFGVTLRWVHCALYFWAGVGITEAAWRLGFSQEQPLAARVIRLRGGPALLTAVAAVVAVLGYAYLIAQFYGEQVSDLYLGQGHRSMKDERWEDSRFPLRRAVEYDPYNMKAHYFLGAAYARLQKYDEAEASLRESIRLNPDYGLTRQILGVIYLDKGRYTDAIRELRRALKVEDNPLSRTGVANAYLALGRVDDAIREAAHAVKTEPDMFEHREVLARALVQAGRLQEAEALMQEGVRRKPDDSRMWLKLADIQSLSGKLQEAVQAYERGLSLGASLDNVSPALASIVRRAPGTEAARKAQELMGEATPAATP
jgi:tetratricopeptide (TPR) repeat protein